MKKSFAKLLSSSIAFTLVLALSGSVGSAQVSKVQAEGTLTGRTAAVVEEVKEEPQGAGIIAALEEKMKEEIPVVQFVKAEASAEAEAALPVAEEVAAPEIKAVAAEEVAAEEVAAEEVAAEEAVAEWDVSATASDKVSMRFYADAKAEAGQVTLDAQTGVVRIEGTGAMEESVYRHFMSTEKYLATVKALFETAYGVEVDLEYDETITDVVELDANIRYYDHATGEQLSVTEDMRMKLNPTDFLAYSPTTIYVGEGITSISDFAFVCCGDLEEVVLPSTVESIGAQAFQYCGNLRRVVLPENAEIGTGAFEYCHNLETVELADEAFYNSGVMAESAENNAPANTLTAEEIRALVY